MISFDEGGLENEVESSLSNTQNYLENANRILQSITIPASFSYASVLRSIPTEITYIYNNVKNHMSWVKDVVQRAYDLENENKNIINISLANNFEGIDFSNGISGLTLLKEKMKQEKKKFENSFLLTLLAYGLAGGIPGLISFIIFLNNERISTQTGSVISEDFETILLAMGLALTTGVGGRNIGDDIKNFLSSTAASIGNIGVSAIKGLANLGELLFDGLFVLEAGISIGVTYVYSAITGDIENWQRRMGNAWKDIGAFVSENYVENAFSDFYKNNAVGQWLDDNAFNLFKSNGIISNLLSVTRIFDSVRDSLKENLTNTAQSKLNELDNTFENSLQSGGQYGTNQGIFKIMKYYDITQYEEFVNLFSLRYNLDKSSVATIMDYLDTPGACSYADVANCIINKYKDQPDLFEETFGFPLYRKTSEGLVINTEDLLFDMYYWVNHENNGGELFKFDDQGNLQINLSDNDSFEDQKYMTREDNLEKYLKSKTDTIDVNQRIEELDTYDENEIKNLIVESVNKGEQVSLRTYGGIKYTDVNSEEEAIIDEGHIVTITDFTEEGLIVDNWGEKYFVNFSDIAGNEECKIYIRDININ